MFKKILTVFALTATLLSLLPSGEMVVSANSYSPYDVPNSIKNMKLNNSTKANRTLNFDSGKKLVYDVYSGNSGQSLKRSWRVENKNFGKGTQPYLTFTGWSAILGHRHHYSNNQETYIRAVNTRTGEQKTYVAQMTNLNASKDIEYNRISDPNKIYNPCSSSRRDVRNDVCNMYYEHVGFKAHLPLNELFPNGVTSSTWELYIIKKVGSKTLWDYLIVPFEFENLSFNQGKLELSSGLNAGRLTMNTSGVIRRHEPRGIGSGLQYGYFSVGKTYTRVTQDEDYTAVWYGVRSPHDSNKTRWASTAYWTFGGQQAHLTYNMNKKTCPDGSTVFVNQACKANVTILHVDKDTGKQLQKETKKATVGQKYSFSPKARGTFKDNRDRPYVPYPANQAQSGTTPNNNFTITFTYRVVLSDPTTIKEISNGTVGKASGDFLWRLEKDNENSESRLRLINNLQSTGTHYQTRNVNYEVSSANVINEQQNKPINVYISNPNDLKGRSVQYAFEYEYTNHYQENYKCVDKIGNDCFEWEFTGNTPVWGSYANTARWQSNLTVDHDYGETYIFEQSSNPGIELIVGRKASVNGTQNSHISTSVQKEDFSVNNSLITILSQNWIPINETIQYSSDFNNPFYINPHLMYYYPNDMDKTLRDQYQNETDFVFSDYAIPLRIDNHNNNLITFKSADNFFVTEKEGFLFSLPSSETSTIVINQKAKEMYENYTGKEFNDEVLTDFINGSRYYFNIDGNGEERPNTWYEHVFVISKLGLSDIQIQLKKLIEFDKYLLGSPLDNPLISEEFDSVIYEDIEYSNSIVMTPEQIREIKDLAKERSNLLHSFRSTDIKEKYNQLQNILPALSP